MEDKDTTIIRVEQQLKDSVQNQNQIMEDLRDLFQRLERESKMTMAVSAEFKGHLENSNFRWSVLEKKLDIYSKDLEDCKKELSTLSDEITQENKERESFQQQIQATIRTIQWLVGVIGIMATVVSTIVFIFQVFLDKAH